MNAAEFPLGLARHYDGLDLLSTAVMLVDADGRIAHVNQAAELLFDTSRKTLIGQLAGRVLGDDAEMRQLVTDAQANAFGQRNQIMELRRIGRDPLPVRVAATVQFGEVIPLVLEVT
ncbi:MAG: PAS domain-containing protein, partial [Pseudomonadota bacterium]|nr:PAS domain-containing protein [Pseudomonadota bacterium]